MPCPNERRKRNLTIAFRVMPEENEMIELLPKAAGVTHQQYIMTKLADTVIVVQSSTALIRL